MNDRELLELAAKAAVFPYQCAGSGLVWCQTIPGSQGGVGYGSKVVPWNPLTDDGDALRLAVRLGFVVSAPIGRAAEVYSHPLLGEQRRLANVFCAPGDDKGAAMRRAIVLAAAVIGEAHA